MRPGVVAVVAVVGCAGSPGVPAGVTPRPERGSPPAAAARPAARPVAPAAAQEPSALRAAIALALEPSPAAESAAPSAEELAPIAALIRDDDPSDQDATDEREHGRVPPESIQRVVHKNAGKFRDCYQRALLRNAAAGGRVVVRFVIGRDGSVARAEERNASLPDRTLRECVLRGFFELSFPNPNEQRIVVEYPLSFARDGKAPLGAIPAARQTAEPPPPGFADAMRAGRRAQPPPPMIPPYVPRTRGASRSSCASGDPMCSDL